METNPLHMLIERLNVDRHTKRVLANIGVVDVAGVLGIGQDGMHALPWFGVGRFGRLQAAVMSLGFKIPESTARRCRQGDHCQRLVLIDSKYCAYHFEQHQRIGRLRQQERTPEQRLKYRTEMLKRKYGLTPDGFDALLASQGGGCAICASKDAGMNGRPMYVDHDHATGRVRGLLCASCNAMIGHGRDDADLMRAGADYLERTAAAAWNPATTSRSAA